MSDEHIKSLERQFEEKIARDEKIEPKDWMPEKYRQTHIRQPHHRAARATRGPRRQPED